MLLPALALIPILFSYYSVSSYYGYYTNGGTLTAPGRAALAQTGLEPKFDQEGVAND